MSPQDFISWCLTAAGFGTTIWLTRRWFAEMSEAMRELTRRLAEQQKHYYRCREELPRRFAEREEVGRLWGKLADLERDAAYVAGLAGRRAGEGA